VLLILLLLHLLLLLLHLLLLLLPFAHVVVTLPANLSPAPS
jgi:hypothetical protein